MDATVRASGLDPADLSVTLPPPPATPGPTADATPEAAASLR